MVTVYTQENCAPCESVKKFLKMKGVEYTLKEREQYADEMLAIGGRVTTPLVVSEKGIAYGFSPRNILELL